ncbi:MAG: YdcF family protein [Vicinamibacterales bacterium]
MRRIALAGLVALAVCALLACRNLGNFLFVEDPLERADTVFVLGGTRLERTLEAADLYRDGWTDRVLLSRQPLDGGEEALDARGIPYTSEPDVQVEALVRSGVPRDRIDVLPEPVVSTAGEATVLVDIARHRGWSRVIVVTSRFHTARAALVMRRRAAGTGIAIVMRATRYDGSDLAHWWRSRGDLKTVPFEAQRYFLYWIGIAD